MESIIRNNMVQFMDNQSVIHNYSLICNDKSISDKRKEIIKKESADKLNEKIKELIYFMSDDNDNIQQNIIQYKEECFQELINILLKDINPKHNYPKKTRSKFIRSINLAQLHDKELYNIRKKDILCKQKKFNGVVLNTTYRLPPIQTLILKTYYPYAKALIY